VKLRADNSVFADPENGIKKFFEHFVDEVKNQIRGGPQARK
jgi:hypothetical protein